MSVPLFDPQAQLFSLAAASGQMFAPDSPFRLFAEKIYPRLVAVRGELASCYCADNGRPAVEPVLVRGVSLLQFLENVPDRQALELLGYHAGWAFALNRALGQPGFDPTVLVRFRERLIEHKQAHRAFVAILEGLQEAGLVARQSKQRLDSMFVMGRLARMSTLEGVRETLRLALLELETSASAFGKPAGWSVLRERYVESRFDYRSEEATLRAKLQQAGEDLLSLWQWGKALSDPTIARGPKTQLDGAYVSVERIAQMQAEGRQLIGPAQSAPKKDGRYSTEDFVISIAERRAKCPAGQENTQCSRLEEEKTGKVSYRFEWSTHCHKCPLREKCLGKDQKHRTLVVGAYHEVLQARRREQKTEAFAEEKKKRNAIEGTQSELVRGPGARRARYRGLAKVRLQNYFIGAACNVKRWIRRLQWEMNQARRTAVGVAILQESG